MAAEPASPSDSMPGMLGEFRVAGVLGEGGSGTVYDAAWGHRRVALKVLRRELVASAADAERFATEAALLQAVDHPGVVKVLGAGTLADGRPWLAMERLDGETLAARIARGPLPAAEAFDLFGQLAAAVHALHRRGLIHRDVKPENVMLVRGFAVLLDFGIAKDQATPASTITQQGGARGTPAYMAPERFFGAPASVQSDVYELAVTCFAMLAGRLPWEHAADPTARLNPPRPSELGVALPAEVETVLMQALSTRAEMRPASAAELGRRIVAAASGPGGAVPRATADLGSAPAAAPARPADPLALAPTVPHPGLADTVASPPRVPAPTPVAATAPPPRRARGRAIAVIAGGAAIAAAAALLLVRGTRSHTAAVAGSGVHAAGGSDPWAGRPVGPAAHGVGSAALDVGSAALVTGSAAPRVRHEAPPGWPDDALALHADDVDFVLGFSPRRLHDSAAFAHALAQHQGSPAARWYAAFTASCAVDPLKEVDGITIGAAERPHAIEIVARGSFTRDPVERCVASLLGAGAKAERRGAVTKLTSPGQTVWLAWDGPHTVLAELRDRADWAYLASRLAHQHALRTVPEMMRLLAEVDPGGVAWGIAGSDASQLGPTLGLTPPPSAAYASLDLSDELAVHAGLRYPTRDAARAAATDVAKRLAAAKQDAIAALVLGDVTIASTGNDARFAMRLSAPLTSTVADALFERADQALPKP